MSRRVFVFICLLLAVLLTAVLSEAQQATKIPRIGFLSANSRAAMSHRTETFQQGLRELGYVEGKNISIKYQFADKMFDRLPALADELVRLNVKLIVTEGPTATRFAKDVTSTIAIVMAQDPDPVGTGFVASLARPGGNITGLSSVRPELSGKRLELLMGIVTRLSRVAVLGTSSTPGNTQSLRETELAASSFGIRLQFLEVLDPKDIEAAFHAASKGRADAILVLASPFLLSGRAQVADFALKSRFPAIYPSADYVDAGGLLSYGASITDLFRRVATYVDKILKGRKPADLPIEQPTKFELVINLKTAKQIGLPIPPNVVARADRVIK